MTDTTSEKFERGFMAEGLPTFHRTITGHDPEGKARFIARDHGDHRRIRKGNTFEATETSLYCTFENPVKINGNDDLVAAQLGWQGGHHAASGTRATMIDFQPGAEIPMHRGESLDYNIVIEGEFELILDSGEVKMLQRGDVNIQRATAHKWRNVSGGGTAPGRLFSVLIDIEPLDVDGKSLPGFFEGVAGPYGFGTQRRVLQEG